MINLDNKYFMLLAVYFKVWNPIGERPLSYYFLDSVAADIWDWLHNYALVHYKTYYILWSRYAAAYLWNSKTTS